MPLLNLLSFTSFKNLRKLLSYKCFTEMPVSLSDVSSSSFGADLELVFIENPPVVGSLDGITGNFTNLMRLILYEKDLFMAKSHVGWVPLLMRLLSEVEGFFF